MDNRFKILLNKEKSVSSVNTNSKIGINLESNDTLIPLSDEQTVVNAYEQFEKERRECSTYRFYGVINTVASNCLYNENVNIVKVDDPKSDLYAEIGASVNPAPNDIYGFTIPANSIFVNDGWYGYYQEVDTSEAQQQNDNSSSLCEFKTFDPGFNRLLMIDSDGKQNYRLKITYPIDKKDITLVENNNSISLKDGIQIIEKGEVTINNRKYVFFKTPINHGLQRGDEIQLHNFIDNQNGGLYIDSRTYTIVKLGNQDNNLPERIFVIDINPIDIDFNLGVSTIKRVINGVESEYYVRVLKTLTPDEKDYDLYPASYGVNYFDDKEAAFYFKSDIDVKDLRDNLGRPLSELFLTIVKNDQDGDMTNINNQYWLNEQSFLTDTQLRTRFWMPIVGGYETENNVNVNYNIRAVGDNYPGGSPNYPQVYFPNIDESDDLFDNDIVEYNEHLLLERTLEEIFHRTNTVYRENLSQIYSNKLDKREGYIYNPHRKIKIIDYSDYVEEGDIINTLNIPDYAHLKYTGFSVFDTSYVYPTGEYKTLNLSSESKMYRWRDLLEIGFVDNVGNGVDYPFESGAHYIYIDPTFYLFRQDPPCDVVFTSKQVTLPSEVMRFKQLVGEPTFFDYSVDDLQSVLGTSVPVDLLDSNISPTTVDIRFLSYFGDYNLGEIDTPGGCIDYSSLLEKTLTDDC